ncbi:MAG: capsular biosynthesis protein [Bacteroidales bacterium]|jgi:tyrosine-protein phosphatase YwqE|nr:capsular biosynthesis protein [Bacteroidales bacterium]
MGLFSHKYSITDKRLLEGATDHHSHILFGVDDGVSKAEESLAILAILEEAGLKSLWLTPHTMEDVPNTTEGLRKRFAELKAMYNGPIELHLASEYMMDELFERHLAEKDFLFHREEGSVLMETSTWSGPYNFWDMVDRTMRAGFRPVLAHPERYEYMGEKEYSKLHGMGVRLQLNYPSLLGYYGSHVKAKAEFILKKGWYDMAGSDCHRIRSIRHILEEKVLKKDMAESLKGVLKV